jgi:hypothetical protein
MTHRAVTRLTRHMTAMGPFAVLRARTAAPASGLGRATAVLLWVMLACDALFLVALVMLGGRSSTLVNVWLSQLTQWVPVGIFWLVAFRTHFRHIPVILAAAGVTLSAAGDTYYSLAMDSEGYLAFPSPADAGYLLFYPLMVAALVVLARRQVGGAGALVLLETAVATVGASAVLAVVLDPTIRAALAGGSTVDSGIALAYPLFDLILLAVVAGIASVPTIQLGRRWWSLITGLAIFAVADVSYALLEHQGSYLAGTPLDASWTIGLGFITWWVAGVPQQGPPPRPAVGAPSRYPFRRWQCSPVSPCS